MFGNKEQDKTKSIIGLAIFGIFIVFLAIMSRTGNKGEKTSLDKFIESNREDNLANVEQKMNDNANSTKTSIFSELEKGNYEFIYTINDNGNTIIYSGKSNTNKMQIDIINKGTTRYYKLGENYLDSNYNIINDIPLTYEKFINLDNLKELYDYSITDREHENRRKVSAYDIYEIYYPDFGFDPFDIDGVEDSYIEVISTNGTVSRVKLDFSTALTYMNKQDTVFIVTLEYSNVGNVGDININ